MTIARAFLAATICHARLGCERDVLRGDLARGQFKPTIIMAPPIESYFAAFAVQGFAYNPASSARSNFGHLCRASGWGGSSPQRQVARRGFQDALVQQFNFLYGIDGKDLAAWQNLCQIIGIEPVPDTLKACRQRVWDAHVNIFDLIEAPRLRRPVRQFDTLEDLARYTKKNDLFFPRQNAYQGGLLQELLREIINPYFGRKRNGSQKKRARRARKRAAAVASTQS